MQERKNMEAKYRTKYKAVPGFIAGFIAVISVSSFHLNAEAYLNPGTGSMILQALIAGIAVLAVTVKMYWFKLVAFVKGETLDEEEDLLAGLDLDYDEEKD